MSSTPFFPKDDPQVAYIRLVARDALPKAVQDRTEGMDQI